ncbi:MAG: hypothetical protein FJ042_04310 [Candidatus Cloacimonetes bacterium]|nr:hypothetical protein [Candidatus Cloacimonadota bacterium]
MFSNNLRNNDLYLTPTLGTQLELSQILRAQTLNYLRITKMKLGLLVNFCSYPKVQIERLTLCLSCFSWLNKRRF